MHLPAFPTYWDYRKVCEIIVASYATGLGALFLFVPAMLAAPHYAAFGGPDATALYGLVMLIAAAGHSFGLWLNGAAPRVSRVIRLLSCAFHMTFTIHFLLLFVAAGIYWGAWANVGVATFIYFSMHRAFNP